jgi:dTDP-4-dehydrorhamnose reductase
MTCAIEQGLMCSWRTKELGEKAFLRENPESTIIRPSIIFGPGDSFFNVRSSY